MVGIVADLLAAVLHHIIIGWTNICMANLCEFCNLSLFVMHLKKANLILCNAVLNNIWNISKTTFKCVTHPTEEIQH